MTGPGPVLQVDDPAAALEWFAQIPGLGIDAATGCLTCGADRILVRANGTEPNGLRGMPFDHLALRVGQLDSPLAAMLAKGAVLHRGYTPDGPRGISAFWAKGVRFAFLRGPGGVPVELCEKLGEDGPPTATGIDHLGLRCADVAATAAELAGPRAERLAQHLLEGGVEVLFLRESGLVWELFDEPAPRDGPAQSGAWAGVAPVTAQTDTH
jgi:catechol 2,3-dioxygenase-like lactoylglutathione lyase family enzyme